MCLYLLFWCHRSAVTMVCSVNAKNTDDLTIEESIIVKLFRSQYVGTFFGLLIHTATYFILRVRSAEISKPYPDNPKKSFFNQKKNPFQIFFLMIFLLRHVMILMSIQGEMITYIIKKSWVGTSFRPDKNLFKFFSYNFPPSIWYRCQFKEEFWVIRNITQILLYFQQNIFKTEIMSIPY